METTRLAAKAERATKDENGANGERATDQLREHLGTVKDDMKEMGKLAQSAASETLEDVKRKARESVKSGREKTEAYENAVLNRVRERPLQSVALAVGVGFLIGFLGRRRS